jgi:hypothetical protein
MMEHNTDRLKLKPVNKEPLARLKGDLRETETNFEVIKAVLGRTLT